MCGIAGMVSFDGKPAPDEALIRRMCDTMTYRGPDDEGIEVKDGVGLGMRRLSIIDLGGGHQPITNEDGSVRVVFNGEIYNYRELRAELEARKHVFKTSTDTETIVHAYEEYGESFATHLNGMFAIALHDSRRRRLVLARDHVGIKPLYYSFDGSNLVWGSEIKVVLASGAVPRSLDHQALGEFLSWEYVPGERTLLKDVRKLGAGSMMTVDLDSPACTPKVFWDVPRPAEGAESIDEQAWIERIEAQVNQSVRMQMVSDVPLGAFLSGGVDSSLTVASMGDAHAFSIGFDDPTYNELPWACRIAEHLGIQHTTEIIRSDIEELFDDLMVHMDDPIGDFSIFPTFLVSRLARRHVTVCLSGDGGDELFGGYETYQADAAARRLPTMLRGLGAIESCVRPSPAKKGFVNKAKRFLEGWQHDPGLHHARWRLFLSERLRSELLSDDVLAAGAEASLNHIRDAYERSGERSHLDRMLYVDFKTYLTDNILVKVDRMSMAVSLEARVPLLDKDLVELAFQVPSKLKIQGNELKSILKKTAARRLPPSCIYRAKQGFSIPIKHWLCTSLKPLMLDLLESDRLRQQGLFQASVVERLIREHLAGTHNHSHVLWSLIVFQHWHNRWMEK